MDTPLIPISYPLYDYWLSVPITSSTLDVCGNKSCFVHGILQSTVTSTVPIPICNRGFTRVVLTHLTRHPVCSVVVPEGLEPPTRWLWVSCSDQAELRDHLKNLYTRMFTSSLYEAHYSLLLDSSLLVIARSFSLISFSRYVSSALMAFSGRPLVVGCVLTYSTLSFTP